MSAAWDDMIAGRLYDPGDADLQARQTRARTWMARYNAALDHPLDARRELLRAGLGHVGQGATARPPFHVDYGTNIHLSDNVFMNFGCVVLDVCPVRIGAGSMFGPMVQLLTADHPRDAATRAEGLEFGRPITIGRDVWVGGGAIILPGVTVGDDAVIGAGAVVTRDVAAGVTVVGNPARVLPARDPEV